MTSRSEASTPVTASLKSTSMLVRLRTVASVAGIKFATVGGVASVADESAASITKSLLPPSEALNAWIAMTLVPGTR